MVLFCTSFSLSFVNYVVWGGHEKYPLYPDYVEYSQPEIDCQRVSQANRAARGGKIRFRI